MNNRVENYNSIRLSITPKQLPWLFITTNWATSDDTSFPF